MPFAGCIRNPRATAPAGGAAGAALVRAPETLAGLDDALAEMRAAGVRRVIVDGGDGTVREVATRAPEIWAPGPPPEYAILKGGNTNLVARHAGGAGGADALAALAEEGRPVTRRALGMIRVDRAGAPLLRGFILGAGAYAAVTRDARAHLAARHGPQVALAVLRLLARRTLREGAEIGLGLEGGPVETRRRLLVAFTSLPRPLFWRLDPFWNLSGRPLRRLDIDAPAPFLPLAAGFIAAGAPRRWMRGAYRSGDGDAAALAPGAEFVLDGDLFPPGEDGLIRLSARESATFVSP